MRVEIGGIIEKMHEDEEGRRIIDMIKIEHLLLVPEDDYIVRMPPLGEYAVYARVKSVEKAPPPVAALEDEVRDATEICGHDFADELRCWIELSNEVLKKLFTFEDLVDQSAPPLPWPEKYWTRDDWQDWLMGR